MKWNVFPYNRCGLRGEYDMKFEKLTKEEYISFSRNHAQANFLNSYEYNEMKAKNGFKTDLVGVKENGEVVAAASIVYFKIKRVFHYAYAPRGIMVDYENKELLTFFVEELKKYLKKEKAIYLLMNPYVRAQQRDRMGNVVEGGYDNRFVCEDLKSLGFEHHGYTTGISNNEIRHMYQIDIPFENEKDLLKSFERNAKREVENALKLNLTFRELNRDEIHIFTDILKDTEKRKNFSGRDLNYYLDMYDAFKPIDGIIYKCVELNVKNALEDTKKTCETLEKEIERMRNVSENLSKKQLNKIAEKENQLRKANSRVEEFAKVYAEKGENIILAAGMWFKYAKEYLCLSSGVYEEYMHFGGPYFMHYSMMKEIMEKEEYERYNFYGISGVFTKDAEDYGVLAFKQGFGGYVEELLGDFTLVIDKAKYKLIHMI